MTDPFTSRRSMRSTMIVYGLASMMLCSMSSCVSDISNDTKHREFTSDHALDDDATDANSMPRQTSGGDPTDDQLDLGKDESSALTCGLQGPFPAAGDWWKYGIYNCHP